MTSKNLFFKLLKEDFKIRIWTFAISCLTFFFSLIVATAMIISIYLKNIVGMTPNEIADDKIELLGLFKEFVGTGNPFLAAIFTVLSIIVAMSGFAYLYSKKKVDMYHSLPVKRETLFSIKIINSILIVLVTYIICVVIATLMLSANVTGGLAVTVLGSIVEWSLLFLLNYFVVILAVMLTGNMLIGMFACGFFYFYFPLLAVMIEEYQRNFFTTYYSSGFILDKILPNMSSIIIILNPHNLSVTSKSVIALSVSLILFILNLFLYKKRDSEAAGKSIAFNIIKLPIKFMIVIFISMIIYVMAYEIMDDSVYWGIFGAVVSGIITHSIMEIIYNQDFKKIFAKKIEMGISIATALALISVFQFDILGYDRYIPKLGNVKRVAVVSDLLESNRGQYCNKMKIWGNEDAPDYADIDYSNYSDDILNLCNTMDIEDKEAVLELAKLCVSGDNSGDAPEQVLISYKLKSGKSVQRVYYMDCETIAAQLAKIYNDESFKKSMYPILTDDGSKIVSVDYNGIENDDKHIDLSDKALRQEFIETYKKELLNFKYENRLTSRPFASIRFNNEYMQRALNIYMRDKGLSGVSIDTTYPQAMRDVGYYPIYPEFTETIRLLKKCGADVIEKIPVEDVDRIEIIYNEKLPIEDIEGGYSYRAETDVFTDAEDIEKILDKLVLCDSPYKDSLNEEIEIGAQIFLKEDKESPFEVGDLHDYSGGYYTNNFHFRRGDLPDNLKYILDKMK